MASEMVIKEFIRRTWSSNHFQASKPGSRTASDSGRVKIIPNKMDQPINEDDQTDVIPEYISKSGPEKAPDADYHSIIDKETEKKIPGNSEVNRGTDDEMLDYVDQTFIQGNVARSTRDGTEPNLCHDTGGKLVDFPDQVDLKLDNERKVLDYGECANPNRDPDGKVLEINPQDYKEAMMMKCEQAGKKLRDGTATKKLTELGDELKKKLPDWQKKVVSGLNSFQEYVVKKKWQKKDE